MAGARAPFRPTVRLECGDALDLLRREPDESSHCIVTSPPYWGLRSYLRAGDPAKPMEMGSEPTPEQYVARLVDVFREARRVLRRDGTLWLVLGDSFASGGCGSRDPERWPKQSRNDHAPVYTKRHAGLPGKSLLGIPWRVAFALQDDGWLLRSDIVWAKTAPMPESVHDRPTRSHEFVFLLAKSGRYFYDGDAVREPYASGGHWRASAHDLAPPGQKPQHGIRRAHAAEPASVGGRNARDVWPLGPDPFPGAHFAVMPEALAERCLLAGTGPYACPGCGAPWRRVSERRIVGPVWRQNGERTGQHLTGDIERGRGTVAFRYATLTTGWTPGCGCERNDGSGRCTVLDPFVGSGTTCAVAARLGRDAIGFDLNPDYCAMARRRVWPEAQPRLAFTGGDFA